jgi:hypothetical protein
VPTGFLLSLNWGMGPIFIVASVPPLLTAAALLLIRRVPLSERQGRLTAPV